jgi:predicted PurR-regulated permease PerM
MRWMLGKKPRVFLGSNYRKVNPMTDNEAKAGSLPTFVTRARPVTALKAIVWGALAVLLYVAHVAFIPLALALLFGLVLSAPVEALHKIHVPRSLSAALILVLALFALGGIVALMWTPAQEWFAKAPQTMTTIRQKVSPIAKFMNHLDDLRKNAGNLGAQGHPAPVAPVAVPAAATQSAPALILDVGAPAIASVLTFVIVTLFLLTGGPPMMARMTAAFVDNLNAAYVLNIIEKVRAEVGHFYLTTTVINVGLGLVTGVAMWAWGMPTPFLWGALAAVLNYIPYAGPGTTLFVITVVAAVSFSTMSQVLGVAGTYVLIAMIEGQVAQPLLVGRRMEVNPLLIFLGLWFGGLFWGIPGVILATPTLVALKVIAENTKSGKPMMEFLGPNDQSPGRDAKLKKFARRLE